MKGGVDYYGLTISKSPEDRGLEVRKMGMWIGTRLPFLKFEIEEEKEEDSDGPGG